MFEREISLILLCIFETIYAVLLLRVGRVVVHQFDQNNSYGRIGGLRHAPPLAEAQHKWSHKYRGESKKSHAQT